MHCDFCLITDGALKQTTGLAGCGGLIRDDSGRWSEGLCFVRGCGVINLKVQLASMTVVRGLNDGKRRIEACLDGITRKIK